MRTENGVQKRVTLEVDFVCNMASKRYYIQSAWRMPDEEKMQQEQRSLSLIDDNFRKMIVVGERLKLRRNERGIVIVGIYDFLLDRSTIDN
jgi:predicted AAA+ superfamily ATPase